MNEATIPQISGDAKSIVNDMRSKDELPFVEMLPINQLNNHSAKATYRNRIFTPILTLFGFLSQVIGADQSCQSAVNQIIAHQISKGEEPPSANTAAYCWRSTKRFRQIRGKNKLAMSWRKKLTECSSCGLFKIVGVMPAA